jgi:hypothetical protein
MGGEQLEPTPAVLRIRAWQNTGGVCVLCRRRINGLRESWTVKPAGRRDGGVSEVEQLGPAHVSCTEAESALETGAPPADESRTRKRSLPFGRKSPLKRKISGKIVRR